MNDLTLMADAKRFVVWRLCATLQCEGDFKAIFRALNPPSGSAIRNAPTVVLQASGADAV